MFSIKTILFPVDFSERCDAAARFVAAFSGQFEARVILLHVIEPAQYLLGTLEFGATALDNFHSELVAESRHRLAGYLEKDFDAERTERVLEQGDPALKIVEVANRENAAIIMMPSHGFGPFRRFILGSVTAKVLHDAHCPVWTGVHMEHLPAAGNAAPINILCAIDLGAQSVATIQFASALAGSCGATLVLVHAVPGIEARPARYFDAELSQTLRREAREEIERIQKQAGTNARVCLGAGDAADVVRYAADHHKADLVVIGRGAAAGHGGGRLKTHAYAIIRQTPCPVISV